MSWESSTEKAARRDKSRCPICAKSPKRDYPAGQVCSVCGYAGAYPYRIPDAPKKKSLLDRTAFSAERRRKSRVTTGDIPDHWIPVRPPGIDEGAFTALYELGWLAYADPLDPVHIDNRQGELRL